MRGNCTAQMSQPKPLEPSSETYFSWHTASNKQSLGHQRVRAIPGRINPLFKLFEDAGLRDAEGFVWFSDASLDCGHGDLVLRDLLKWNPKGA